MKTLLLINPHNSEKIRTPGYFLMPLSLLYLSGSASDVANTHILDLNVVKSSMFKTDSTADFVYSRIVADEVHRLKPDFIGINCLFSGQFETVKNIAIAAKEARPSTVVIIGGMHPTIYNKEILEHCQFIDIVVIGEGEQTLRGILTSDNNNYDRIEGIAFRNSARDIVVNPKESFVSHLDEMPLPDYSLFNFKGYQLDTNDWFNPKNQDIKTSVPILTSRSCPYKCNFCAMNLVMGTKFRARSAEHVFSEMKLLYNDYGVSFFHIMDDNSTLDKKRIKELCTLIINSKMNISFDMCNGTMPSTLDDDVIDLMVEAGFISCFLAIESGSDYIRNTIMGKNVSKETICRVVERFRTYKNVHLAAFFLMGMPEETLESLMETYNFIDSLDLDSFKVAVATPFPGTKLFDQCVRDNLLLSDKDSLKDLWNNSDWYLQILNTTPPFLIKPYNLQVSDLKEFVRRFEYIRHRKHVIAESNGRITFSIANELAEFRKQNPGCL